MQTVPHNRVCNQEDLRDPSFAETVSAIFSYERIDDYTVAPNAPTSPRHWEAGAVIGALRSQGLLAPESTLLVVGAGWEPLVFYLIQHVHRVFAVDRYLTHDASGARLMMMQPADVQPYETPLRNLVVQHMDERQLNFPDDTFDGVIVLGTLERAQSLQEIAWAAYEWGRVLKPGGIVSVCAKYRLAAPPGQKICRHMLLPNIPEIQHYVVEASGLEPIDELRADVTDATLASGRDISRFATAQGNALHSPRLLPDDAFDWLNQPFLVHVYRGFVFSSIHLALRKTESYAASANGWAKPGPSVQELIRRELRALVVPTATQQNLQVSQEAPMQTSPKSVAQLRTLYHQWERVRMRGWFNKWLHRVPKPISFIVRNIVRIYSLGHLNAAQAEITIATINHIETVEQQLSVLQNQKQALQQEMQQVTGLMNESSREFSAMRSEIAEIQQQVQQQGKLVASIAHAIEATSNDQRHTAQQLASLGHAQEDLISRLAALSHDQATIEDRLRLALGSARLANYRHAMEHGGLSVTSMGRVRLGDVRFISDLLAQHIEGFDRYQAIEISMQGEDTETIVTELSQFIGERMSSSGISYRYPNDLWLHFDLTGRDEHKRMLENAASRLTKGGLLVVITEPEYIPSGDARFSTQGTYMATVTGGQIAMTVMRYDGAA
jgi:SAM-dependent methyltransferase